ncbi:MAG: LuxR C-terminal-related transcriptional regulator [Gemmatimonadota bacterium]
MARTMGRQGTAEAPGAGRRAAARAAGRPGFLEDKLRVPRPSFPVLRRRRVSGLLEEATRHRVTLVSGPAGAGKTVACASWASAGPAGRRVAWLTLDAADRQEWFWAYLCAGLTRVRAAPADTMRVLADGPADGFPLRLVQAAQAFPEPVVLILDDLHELTDQAVLRGLDVLIRHAPPSLRLVLCARQQPGLQLARLRVAGELADISGADLACTAAEADAYFAMLGLEAEPAERDELLRRTQGWMAGLRLAAMRAGPDGGKITALAGYEPIVTDYLRDEVLGRQHPETRAFLLRTCITGSVCGDLADALTGGHSGARTLERLSRENSFVEPAAGGGGEYRYHPLLRESLTAQLHRELPQEVPALLSRAAHWYAGHGRVLDGVRCAAEAGDWDYAARVLADAGPGTVLSPGPAELEAVLTLFPAGRAADDAAVATAWAAARLWGDDPEGAGVYLDSAERSLGRCAPELRPVLEPALAGLRLLQAAGQGGPDGAQVRRGLALAEQGEAAAATQGEHRALGLLWFALGVTALRRWEIAAARHTLRHADRQFGAGGLAGFRIRARAWRALAEAWHGDLIAARRNADEVRKAAISAPRVAGHPAGQGAPQQAARLAVLAYAHVSLGQDDLVAAQRLLDELEADRVGHFPGEPPVTEVANLIRARILLADGDATAARATLCRLREVWGAADPAVADLMTVAEAEAALRGGDTGRARALLLMAEAAAPGWRADVCLTRGWLMLADGEFQAALDAVRPWLAGAGGGLAGRGAGGAPAGQPLGTRHDQIAALLVAAVAYRRLGEPTEAVAHLEQALAQAEPERAYRVFLDGGSMVRSALTVLIPPTSRHAGFAGRVLERFDAQGSRPAILNGDQAVRLTDSERAVLCFLPSHMTNEEISQALFLSINTVKTHLRSAYRKLGVGSRREAIARGRRLGVLLAV